jgi:hypothetical protein
MPQHGRTKLLNYLFPTLDRYQLRSAFCLSIFAPAPLLRTCFCLSLLAFSFPLLPFYF